MTHPTHGKVDGYTVASTVVVREGEGAENRVEMVEHPVFNHVENMCVVYFTLEVGTMRKGPHQSKQTISLLVPPALLGGTEKALFREGVPQHHRFAGHCAVRLRNDPHHGRRSGR